MTSLALISVASSGPFAASGGSPAGRQARLGGVLLPLALLLGLPMSAHGAPAAAAALAAPAALAVPSPATVSPPGFTPSGPATAPPPAPSGAALLEGDEPLVIGPGRTPVEVLPVPPLSQPAARPAVQPPATPERELVLNRSRRLLEVVENGRTLHRFPVAVGMPGWETPVGRFKVLEKTQNPIWEHPEKGTHTPPGPENPLGSRWIGFHRDCGGRRGWDGEQMLDVKGCVVAGFHGTPHRWTVGRAVSHGCVRLYDEDVRLLFDLVSLGMPVTVLP